MTNRLIRLREVLHKTGYSKPSIYRSMKLGTFPRSVKLGARACAWSEQSVDSWIKDRLAGASTKVR